MKIFVLTKKTAPFLDPFLVQNLAIFAQKIKFSVIFFETTHQICLKLGQKLGTVALNHQMTVLCLENSCFGCFGHFWVKNYIACGVIILLWAVLAIFLQTVDYFLLIFVI